MIEQGRDELTDEFRREGLPVQKIWSSEQFAEVIAEHSYVDLDAFLAAIGEHHVSARSVAQRVAKAFRDGRRRRAAPDDRVRPRRHARDGTDDGRRARRGPRRRAGAPRQLLHAGARRRHHRLRHPRPRRQRAPSRLRQRDVARQRAGGPPDRRRVGRRAADATLFTAGVEVVALDRSRLLRDVANALGDHHVNIVACETVTGDDRVAKMRFEFELADPGHLSSVLSTIKQIDAVYDAHPHPSPAAHCSRAERAKAIHAGSGCSGSLVRRADVPDQPRDARHPRARVGALARASPRCSPTSSRPPATSRSSRR